MKKIKLQLAKLKSRLARDWNRLPLVQWYKNTPWFQEQKEYIQESFKWECVLIDSQTITPPVLDGYGEIIKPFCLGRIVSWWTGEEREYGQIIRCTIKSFKTFNSYSEAEAYGNVFGVFGKNYYIKSV